MVEEVPDDKWETDGTHRARKDNLEFFVHEVLDTTSLGFGCNLSCVTLADQLSHFFFINHRDPQLLRLVEFGTRISSRDNVIGFLAD